MAESGGLVALRESALYAENVDRRFLCPQDRIDQALAREVLLLALEVWDDRLVGLTNHNRVIAFVAERAKASVHGKFTSLIVH
ncbi:MAG: hypothetical protein CBARDCOR_2934 [uncultured Caballeronia sp.]|nr:MAG: hypothetical protein CBARDCOR_2934 [uncultured Caballeronia sp.]